MRKTFHEKLDEVTEDIIKMGSLVQDTVRDAIDCLIYGDLGLAQKIIDGDTKIDEYDITIEEKCMYLQAEHQPVARDLRLIHSIYIIVIYIERIGDISVSIARLAKRLHRDSKMQISKPILDIMIEMGNVVMQILDKALKAFKNKDAKLALKLDHIDDNIDQLQKNLYQKLYSTQSMSEDYIRFVTNISLASRYLERIGDNSVNIGDRVIYYLTGDFRAIHSDL